VAALAVGGSVARGWADRHSDIELVVWWRRAPTASARTGCAGGIPEVSERRDFGHRTDRDAWTEDFTVSGVKFDVTHRTIEGQDRVLAQVVDRFDTSVVRQQAVAEVESAIGIHGHEILERWRRRADPYPASLARAMVETHLRFGPNVWLDRLAERDEALPLAEISVTVATRVFGVLLGLNRRYHPGNKWMDRTLASLTVCPTDLRARIRAVLGGPARSRVVELQRLIEDTIALVERELPEIDTASVRARVQTPARVWNRPPPRLPGRATGRPPG